MTDAYKQRRDEARKAVEQAIVNARANAGVTDATPQELPQDKDKPKPVPVPVPNEATDEATQVHTPPTPKDPPKPLEVPKFCTWASSVCNFMDWVKQEVPEPPSNEQIKNPSLSDLGIDDTRFDKRINFDGQCPTGKLEFTIKGNFFSKPIPYTHFCELLKMLKPWLLAFTYLSTAYFVVSNL